MGDKIYYTTEKFRQEPIEFFDGKDLTELNATYTGLAVRECTTAKALNLLLGKIRFLENIIQR